MADVIQLLPDSVANQIAAGEVVQRPASVVKELIENSIDAGASKIQVVIKDAGKTLIQVIDNGIGMSEIDARMCFERHATSKIRKANDLFGIRTMGFRGEAMASIAAIATVQLKTKKADSDLGVRITISGSVVDEQEPVSCPNGTNLMVKNLFFNVPARRKFLKSNSTEFKHIMEEFQRVALSFPGIEMILNHNEVDIYNLPPSNIHNRIVNILGKAASKTLLPIQSETSMAKIKGYVGKPETARRTGGEQFFFVNNRYMRHPYFYKAVVSAYENIMQQGLFPSFFIYFDVPPSTIDINIHPTKTEIKFENERNLWPIIKSTVRECLGKYNVVPSIDFSNETAFEVPVLRKGELVSPPQISINPNYNPFETQGQKQQPKSYSSSKSKNVESWEQLYSGFEKNNDLELLELENKSRSQLEQKQISTKETGRSFLQIKGKYILTAVKSGLMLIDQKRAHERILFDEYIYKKGSQSGVGQRLLYPQKLELDAVEAELLKVILCDVNTLGFEIEEFGVTSFVVNSIPVEFPEKEVSEWITGIIDLVKENQKDFKQAIRENLVRSLAKFLSIPYGEKLEQEEMAHINDMLFASQDPSLTPEGKKIITIMGIDEIEKKFK